MYDNINNIKLGSKIERIYRILLDIPNKKKSWYKIAKEARVAYGWAHNILSTLQDKGIIIKSKVLEPRELLYLWADRPNRRLYRDYHIQNPKELLRKSRLDYALTTYYAENLIGGYLFPRYYDIYIRRRDAVRWNNILTEVGIVGGGNFRTLLGDSQVFWKREYFNEVFIVSIQQLIVDLIREGAECEEAADILITRFYDD